MNVMKNFKRFCALGLAFVMIFSLTGCSFFNKKKVDEGPTKEELQSELNSVKSQLASLQSELQGTKEVLATYNENLGGVNLSSLTILPTGEEAYTSINGKIRLSSVLDMSPSMSLPNTTVINLGGDIQYNPSNNWTFELSNNVLTLQHKNGMIVNLKVYKYAGSATQYDVMDSIIRPYLKNLSVSEVGSKKLFINNTVVGGMVFNTMQVKSYADSDTVEEYVEETTEETTEEVVAETLENGETVESSDTTGANNGFGSLDETETESASANEETIAEPDSESAESEEAVTETDENGNVIESTDGVGSLGDLLGDGSDTTQGLDIIEEPDYDVEEYTYDVAVIFNGDYALTMEFFYKNDENASIQQELLTSCLSSISINSNKLVSE
jgi:hypothetical protein